ncbi:MAG: flagellar basal body L-ring protein FlgH [Zetaproteobacteria bacterium]|nr:flagellar basal body L-ring protein FlgH [Zetaproteobacteria bacterium]
MMFNILLSLMLLGGLSACMPQATTVVNDFEENKEEQEAFESSGVTHEMRESNASLWSDGGRDLFSSIAHRKGDLLTITINEAASAKRQLDSATNKSSSAQTGLNATLGMNQALINSNITPGTAFDVSNSRSFKGNGSTSNSDTLTASLSAVVVEVYPNGNLRIKGKKLLVINHQPQKITFSGIVRPQDIISDNSVPSSKVAQARIDYGSGGQLARSVHEGWVAQTLEEIWPF